MLRFLFQIEYIIMRRLNKQLLIVGLMLLLNACVSDQAFKVQFEPTLPVPFLIVPDDGEENHQNDGYQQNNQYPQTNQYPQDRDYQQNTSPSQYPNYPEYQYNDYGNDNRGNGSN